MQLMERAKEELSLDPYMTLMQAAEKAEVSYPAIAMWLRRNPKIPLMRVGDVLVVHKDVLNKYNHR